jgi:pimeloyl-ACP methyl ester carboxylesterase
MFRHLVPRLASSFRVIAPDLPGFGFTEVPAGLLEKVITGVQFIDGEELQQQAA